MAEKQKQPGQYNAVICEKRKYKDIMKLLLSNYKVLQSKKNSNELFVIFNGPKQSHYQAGIWNVCVLLPLEYPYKSPSIGFLNKIYHPNIDEKSGTVCLDVINQTWSPMFDLVNIFDIFLPQLLHYPNPDDPLNSQAAELYQNNQKKYQEMVYNYVQQYASQPIDLINNENIKKLSNFDEYDNGRIQKKVKVNQEQLEKIQETNDGIIESDDEIMSKLSDISDLSQTSNLDQLKM